MMTGSNYNVKRLFAILCLLMAGLVGVYARNNDVLVNLRLDEGLSGETVYRVMADHSNHIWIATNNGVNAYNGKRITQFSLSDDTHPTVLVHDLCEVANKSIWAATEIGVFRLNIGDSRFQRILPEISSAIALLSVGDTVYIGGEQGLQMCVGEQLKTYNVGATRRGLDNIVRHFVKDDDGRILFLGRYGINAFDPRTEKISHVTKDDELPQKTAVTQFEKDGQRLFIGTQFAGLLVFDLQTRQCIQLNDVGNVVRTVRKSSDGYICIATDGAGAFLVNPKTLKTVEAYNTSEKSRYQLPTNALYSYYRGEGGVNWFGFVRYGLSYTYHIGDLFKPYIAGDFSSEGINVRSFCMHGHESVIGTQEGFWYVDTVKNVSRYFSPHEFGGGHIVNSIAWLDGEFYIGTYDGGLRVFNPHTMSLRLLRSTRLLDYTTIGDVKRGPDGRLWVGSGEGLFIISKDGSVTRFTEQNSHIVGGLIISITFDRQGNAWLTGASGISLYSAASGEITSSDFPEGFFDKQPYMRGASGHDGKIYMRDGPRLFYCSEGLKAYGEIKLPVRFTDKWCRGFVDDMTGHYWLASERGLFCLDYGMKQVVRFGQGAGLRGDFINDMALQGNSLWVATSQGLYSTDLREKGAWKQQTDRPIQLYDIQQGNRVLTNSDIYTINDSYKILLGWNIMSELFLTKVVLLDYAKQSGRFYEYRIDGGTWRLIQDGEIIELSKLWPGKYRLDIRLAGVDVNSVSYEIRVVPTIMFLLEVLLVLSFVVAVWLWYRWRGRAKWLLTERNEIEEALIEATEELEVTDTLQKYQRVKIDEKECESIVRQMQAYIERERVYTDAELKMKDLADVLHLSPSKLSQVFNLYLKENYYEFINRYRLAEFKRLIEAGEYKRYTITALSEQCGFKKSNFFSTFRKVEGMTPAEYLKKKGVKV